MFIWEFVAAGVLEQIVDWIYQTVAVFLGDFFSLMGQMGADLFELPWVAGVVLFFTNLGWALFTVGLVVAGFEFAIEAQNGRGDLKATCLNIFKGFFAVSLFGSLPVQLYRFCVSLQGQFAGELSGVYLRDGIGGTAQEVLHSLAQIALTENAVVRLFIVIMSMPVHTRAGRVFAVAACVFRGYQPYRDHGSMQAHGKALAECLEKVRHEMSPAGVYTAQQRAALAQYFLSLTWACLTTQLCQSKQSQVQNHTQKIAG